MKQCSVCKTCDKKAALKRYHKNPEKRKDYRKEKIKTIEGRLQYLIFYAKKRAKSKGRSILMVDGQILV